jgi:hypothetical protein
MSGRALKSAGSKVGLLCAMALVVGVAGAAIALWPGMRDGQRQAVVTNDLPWSVSENVLEKETVEHVPVATKESTTVKVPSEPKPVPEASGALSAVELSARADRAVALAQASPIDALRWASALPLAERATAVVAAANEAARTKPAEALAALVELDSSADRDAAITHAASQWAVLDPKGAAAWAADGAPGELREQTCSAVAIAIAERDPRTAAGFVASQMADGVSLRTAAVAVAQRWAQQDGDAAKAWAEQFPEAALRENALKEIEFQRRQRAEVK